MSLAPGVTQKSSRIDRALAAKTARAAIVLALSLAYLAYVFELSKPRAWTAGLGDWMDPYFINALLEHWYRAILDFGDPSSPPMYYPAGKTLGYSHGLILYAPFYVPLRLFLHPFQAYNFALFLVLEVGAVCLYLFFRRAMHLSFLESIVLSAFFVSSENVTNGTTSIWSQRASVFLVPPILLMMFAAVRRRHTAAGRAVGFLAALLAMLLYTQDFYTAHLAFLFAGLFLIGAAVVEYRVTGRLVTSVMSESRGTKITALATLAAAAWAISLAALGGGSIRLLGLAIRSNDWRRPALLAGVLFAVLIWLRGARRSRDQLASPTGRWVLALAAGAALGAVVFLWIYLDAYFQHRGFPEQDLLNQMIRRDAAFWRNPLEGFGGLARHYSLRSSELVLAVAVLLWLSWRRVDGKSRLYALWLVVIAAGSLLAPVRFGSFSLWSDGIAWLPGFGVIRDPKRLIYLYELAAVLGVGFLLARLPSRSFVRLAVPPMIILLIVLAPNRERFASYRPIDVYERWVAAPIDVDPSCSSFFMKGASTAYMSRRGDMRWVYNVDATFVALNRSIPTLNGYSAWAPAGWGLHNPHHEHYGERVAQWIEQHRLTGVCEFDIDARTMKPYSPTP